MTNNEYKHSPEPGSSRRTRLSTRDYYFEVRRMVHQFVLSFPHDTPDERRAIYANLRARLKDNLELMEELSIEHHIADIENMYVKAQCLKPQRRLIARTGGVQKLATACACLLLFLIAAYFFLTSGVELTSSANEVGAFELKRESSDNGVSVWKASWENSFPRLITKLTLDVESSSAKMTILHDRDYIEVAFYRSKTGNGLVSDSSVLMPPGSYTLRVSISGATLERATVYVSSNRTRVTVTDRQPRVIEEETKSTLLYFEEFLRAIPELRSAANRPNVIELLSGIANQDITSILIKEGVFPGQLMNADGTPGRGKMVLTADRYSDPNAIIFWLRNVDRMACAIIGGWAVTKRPTEQLYFLGIGYLQDNIIHEYLNAVNIIYMPFEGFNANVACNAINVIPLGVRLR